MIKIDIANALMKIHPCSRQTALEVVDLLTDRMKQALLDGHRIEIRGFGVFEPRPRKKGMGRNIKTGDAVKIPNGKSIRFKPGKDLRDIEVK
ncbi:MAG TPA: HU family DNA-binding protein [Holophagaceae bacterium]|nr:integration host factor subunit beta [Acidobacteriota bacterium]HJV91380.1 HU family DNA-binding protein [Holophagaceae bacterium]HJW33122.1 HU family DNA-binding protein [Holophagaceae bacterium]